MRRGFLTAMALAIAACATAPPPPGVIPTVEFEGRGPTPSPYFVVFVSGDGGWRKIDVKVTDVLRDAGMPVVGILANSYFARERTPQDVANDLDKLIREYGDKWQRQRVVLVGYSRGAEALPFMINRMPDDTRRRIALVALLGPAETTRLAIGKPDRLSLTPEIKPLDGMPMVCVVGTLEKHSICRILPAAETTSIVTLRGGHHFGGSYRDIGRAILDALARRG